ncbi:MAG: regulatory protein RecX [Lutibacter sp.]
MKYSKSYTVQEAQKILEHYCAYQERCHQEVEKKLEELNMIPAAKEHIILYLIQHQYLNEERFSKAFTRGKFYYKNWGKLKIIRELKFRNISSYNIESGLKEIDEIDYFQTLEKLAQKKLLLIKDSNPFIKRKKLTNYLLSKGFEANLVYSVAKQLTS